MSDKHKVCHGAICKCKFGNMTDKLKVLTQKKHYINDKDASSKLVACHVDLGNTFEKNTFGECKLQPLPGGRFKTCNQMLQQWTGQYEDVTYQINGGHPLLEDSIGICAIGGPCIEITHHGQTAEPTQQNIENADQEVLAVLLPFVDVKQNPVKYIPIEE